MTAPTPLAAWLPPAVRDTPGEQTAEPRLLDALLDAVAGQYELLAADADEVWEDFFIESCAEWAIPYIGALVGAPADAERLEVAFAIALRRRKGTPSALEDFAEIVTGLTARVVEGWQVAAWVQRLGHPPPPRPFWLGLGDGSAARVGGPFERTRRSFSPSGRFHPRAATVIVWPWEVRTYRDLEAAPLPESQRFALHPLGAEAPLYLRPASAGVDELRAPTGDERDAPVRADYRVVQALAGPGQIVFGTNWAVSDQHPLALPSQAGRPTLLELTLDGALIPWTSLRFGSLPPGAAAPGPPTATRAVVDLMRGHVELGASLSGTLRATWHRPAPAMIGALASEADGDPAARVVVRVNPTLPVAGIVVHDLASAFTLAEQLCVGTDPDESDPSHPDVEIRIETSDRLAAPTVSLSPTLPRWRLLGTRTATPTILGDLAINLDGGCLTLEGFQLTGDLTLGAGLDGVEIRSITMNPTTGATLQVEGGAWGLALSVRGSLLGRLRADLGARPIVLEDCVVDGRGAALRTCGGDPGGTNAAAVARRTTFAPAIQAESADAIDCIFVDGLEVLQQQEGCLRHCFVAPDTAGTPSRPVMYRCLETPPPTFASVGFEAAGYYALDLEAHHPLRAAASDGGEPGAYHHRRRAARLARLERRLHEFVPLDIRPRLELAPWEE
jgi:hypothetical protein